MKTLYLAMALVATVLVGCSNGKVDLFKGAETAVHLKLLDAEFEQVVHIVQSQKYNPEERAVINKSIAEVQVEVEFVRELHKQNAGRIAIAGMQAQAKLNEITSAVQTGKDAHQLYLERTKQDANPQLIAYYKSAVLAKDRLQEAIDSGRGVTGVDLAQYLTLGLRVIAAANGVPMVDKQKPGRELRLVKA